LALMASCKRLAKLSWSNLVP